MKRTTARATFAAFLGALLLSPPLRAGVPFDIVVDGPTPRDPLILQGDYTPATQKDAPILICLHGLGSGKEEWKPLAEAASARGWGLLAYDLRGHGGSRSTLKGVHIDYQDPANGRSEAFWRKMPEDLALVMKAMNDKGHVASGRIVLVGASVGANAALIALSKSTDVLGGVALSPGLEYAGLKTEPAMALLPRPALLVAARPDFYAYNSASRLKSLAPAGRVVFLSLEQGTKQGAHGAQLFDGVLEERILNWIKLLKPPKPVQPPAGTDSKR